MEELKHLQHLVHNPPSPGFFFYSFFYFYDLNTSSPESITADLFTYQAPGMAKKTCPDGQNWDILLKTCHSWQIERRRKPQPPTGEFYWPTFICCLLEKYLTSVSWTENCSSDCLLFNGLVDFNPLELCLSATTDISIFHLLVQKELNLVVLFLSELVLTVEDQLRTKITTSEPTMVPSMLMLSQTLWICVVLVTLGSVVALTLWLVLFRRQTRVGSNPGKSRRSSICGFVWDVLEVRFNFNNLQVYVKPLT